MRADSNCNRIGICVAAFGRERVSRGSKRRLRNWRIRRGWRPCAPGLSVLIIRLAILPIYPIPLPFVPDDFSFLLAADTFAHGRLTNPTPAMWIAFRKHPHHHAADLPVDVLSRRRIAAGGRHGCFRTSVVRVVGDGCAFVRGPHWMLQAWLPRELGVAGRCDRRAAAGGFSDWINTYHTGGSLAALGGSLVLGGLPRLMKTARFRYGLLMAIGIAILALTRPYEGLLLCLPVAFVLGPMGVEGQEQTAGAVLMRRRRRPWR